MGDGDGGINRDRSKDPKEKSFFEKNCVILRAGQLFDYYDDQYMIEDQD